MPRLRHTDGVHLRCGVVAEPAKTLLIGFISDLAAELARLRRTSVVKRCGDIPCVKQSALAHIAVPRCTEPPTTMLMPLLTGPDHCVIAAVRGEQLTDGDAFTLMVTTSQKATSSCMTSRSGW